MLYDLACFYYISGNTTKYNYYLEQVKVQGREFLSRDMEAAYEARQACLPNIYLLKADLLVRGGYCSRANIELSRAYKYGLISADERLKYHYPERGMQQAGKSC